MATSGKCESDHERLRLDKVGDARHDMTASRVLVPTYATH